MATVLGGTSACLISHDLVATGQAVIMAELHPEVMPLYNEHYHKLDAWALAQKPWLGTEHPTLDDESVLPRRDLKKTEFYPYVRKYGISRMMHTTLRVHENGVSGLSVYRTEAHAPFGGRETAFLKALAPHLGRALRLSDVLARAAHERATALDGLDAIRVGVLLVTGEARVVHANRTAAGILAGRDGLFLDRSVLTTGTVQTTSALRQRCAECANTTLGRGLASGGALTLTRPSGQRDLHVLVSPVKRLRALGIRDKAVAALVFVADPEQDVRPQVGLLQILYGLTPAESEVAALLASDKSVAEIAEACGYTPQTVRWYSKQILSKTGRCNRAALVRQLSTTLASLNP